MTSTAGIQVKSFEVLTLSPMAPCCVIRKWPTPATGVRVLRVGGRVIGLLGLTGALTGHLRRTPQAATAIRN